jgi:hypothetical protein
MPSNASTRVSESRNRTKTRMSSGFRSTHSVRPGGISNTWTSRSLSGNGSARIIVALTTATTALAAPMTSVSVAMTTSE